MSRLLPPDQYPPGIDKGELVPLDPIQFRDAFATVMQTIAGVLPPDDDFPTEFQNAETGNAEPLEDTPTNRGLYKAAKRFDDDNARSISFMFRFKLMFQLAMTDPKYAKYRDDAAGTMHIALLAAVATMPFNRRTTKKELKARLDQALKRAMAVVDQWEEKEPRVLH